jgi:hypothetical protein
VVSALLDPILSLQRGARDFGAAAPASHPIGAAMRSCLAASPEGPYLPLASARSPRIGTLVRGGRSINQKATRLLRDARRAHGDDVRDGHGDRDKSGIG